MPKSNAIIIKRVKKHHAAHHGGAWKVAYADFVTAMMAFFLLLWLLNATTDKQKRGIADYFAPTLATQSTVSGAAGVMGGKTMMQPGSEASDSAPPAISQGTPSVPSNPDSDDNESFGPGSSQGASDQSGAQDSNAGANQNTQGAYANGNSTGGSSAKITDAQFRKEQAARENKQFAETQKQLQQAIQNVPALQALSKNFLVDQTDEGLRIQIVDLDHIAMFALGSTAPSDAAQKLMALVAQAISHLPNRLAITGHTDSTPYVGKGDYSNWELSTDRANAARRLLVADGLPIERIATVDGRADTQNLIKDNPADPRNRRISIVVLRNSLPDQSNEAAAPPATADTPPQQAADSSITVTNSFGAATPIGAPAATP